MTSYIFLYDPRLYGQTGKVEETYEKHIGTYKSRIAKYKKAKWGSIRTHQKRGGNEQKAIGNFRELFIIIRSWSWIKI